LIDPTDATSVSCRLAARYPRRFILGLGVRH
jgi:hypothetical protein